MTGDAGAVGAGEFTLEPSEHEQNAVGWLRVPPSAQPGTYEIAARCSDGKRLTGDVTVTLASARASTEESAKERGEERGKEHAEERGKEHSEQLAEEPAKKPSEKRGKEHSEQPAEEHSEPTAGERTEEPAQEQVHPRGSVKTGVGGAPGPDPARTAAGVAALAVAAAGGTWLLHRRARGDGI
nr:hypothetical protein [Streptomyces sporangiiformans]